MQKTFEGYRVVLEMDKQWFAAVAEMTSFTEYGELMNWISTDPITVTREVCDICDIIADETGYIEHDDDMHEEDDE